MKRYSVTVSASADEDLFEIWSFVVREASVAIADSFLDRIMKDCMSLQNAPSRGLQRALGGQTVRLIGAAKGRVTLIFTVSDAQVEILRVHYAGTNHESR
jgi:plasmid stabilization system protein ParE